MVQDGTLRMKMAERKTHYIGILLMLLSFLLFLFGYAAAAGQTDNSLTKIDDTVSETVFSSKHYVHEQSFSTNYSIKGYYSTINEYFLTGLWEIHNAQLSIDIASSQLLEADLSFFEISLNGVPFYTGHIPETNGKRMRLTIDIPTKLISINGYNSITIVSYPFDIQEELIPATPTVIPTFTQTPARTAQTDDSLKWIAITPNASITPTITPTVQEYQCLNEYKDSVWVNFYEDTSVTIDYSPRIIEDHIDQFIEEFVSINALENNLSQIAIPLDAAEAPMTCAANLLSGLSSQALLSYENIQMNPIQNWSETEGAEFVIFISQYDFLPQILRDQFTYEELEKARNGVIAAVKQIGEQNILIITGNDDETIKNAGFALTNPEFIKQLEVNLTVISAETDFKVPAEPFNAYLPLTEYGTYLRGFFHQAQSFYFNVPANRAIMNTSSIHIDYSYAKNLNFDYSMITVYINNIPIGSKKLTKENAASDWVEFDFPDNLELHGDFSIIVAFDLGLETEDCIRFTDELPWAYIANTSLLKLNSIDHSDMIFENYPSPFIRDGHFNELLIALPAIPDKHDIQALAKIMLVIGKYRDNNTGNFEVLYEPDAQELEDKNIIAIGRWDRNNIIRNNWEALLFKISSDGRSILSNDQIVLDPSYAQQSGFGQIIISPYSDYSNALLIISGTTDEGLDNAARYLGKGEYLWQLEGDTYLSAGAGKLNTFQVAKKTELTQFTDIFTTLSKNGKSISNIAILAGLIVLLCLFTAFLILLKNRRN